MLFCDNYSVLLANRMPATPVRVIFPSNGAVLGVCVVGGAYPEWIRLAIAPPPWETFPVDRGEPLSK